MTHEEYPWLLDALLTEYQLAMQKRNEQLKEQGASHVIDVSGEISKARSFVEFARSYLDKHRPQQLMHVDRNYGVQLTNQITFLVSPSTGPVEGAMQPSHSVPISGRDTMRDLVRREMGEGMPISNPFEGKSIPEGARDLTQEEDAQDLTIPQPMQKFDK